MKYSKVIWKQSFSNWKYRISCMKYSKVIWKQSFSKSCAIVVVKTA
jgi:hypothetical protein